MTLVFNLDSFFKSSRIIGLLVRHCDQEVVLTESRSSGRFSPLLIPLFMEMKRSRVVLSFTQGLWRLVLSMMMANDRM